MSIIRISIFISLTINIISCTDTEYIHDEINSLKSPNGKSIFYRVFDESTMAFGSGRTKYIILESHESIDKIDVNEFIKFPKDNLNFIKVLGWQDDNNILVLSVSKINTQPTDLNPIEIDTLSFKKWNIVMFHYNVNAYMNDFENINKIQVFGDSVYFEGNNGFERIVMNGQISMDSNGKIEIFCLEKDMNFVRKNAKGETLKKQPKVALIHCELAITPTELVKIDTNKITRIIKKEKK